MRYLMHQPSRQSSRWRRFARRHKAPVSVLSAAARAALVEHARLSARRNDTVELVRSLTTPVRKRGGARYGPAPEKPPHERMQAPEPMGAVVRADVYGEGSYRLTDRQERQLYRMALRAGANISRGLDAKHRPTPKRKASR